MVKLPIDAFRVVCLAGSAGSLQAYKSILDAMYADTGMAFVIVSHRSLVRPDLFGRLLALHTRMAVVDARDGMRLSPNCVFLAPPHMDISTDGLVLNVAPQSKRCGWPNMISIFLDSMAVNCKSRSIAIILSGVGHDGTSALRGIRQAGGITLAQSDPIWNDMPEAAILCGEVDSILTASQIGLRMNLIGAPGGRRAG